nr:basic salivary proline-rich protein 1-like [Dasypus novemcinctus]
MPGPAGDGEPGSRKLGAGKRSASESEQRVAKAYSTRLKSPLRAAAPPAASRQPPAPAPPGPAPPPEAEGGRLRADRSARRRRRQPFRPAPGLGPHLPRTPLAPGSPAARLPTRHRPRPRPRAHGATRAPPTAQSPDGAPPTPHRHAHPRGLPGPRLSRSDPPQARAPAPPAGRPAGRPCLTARRRGSPKRLPPPPTRRPSAARTLGPGPPQRVPASRPRAPGRARRALPSAAGARPQEPRPPGGRGSARTPPGLQATQPRRARQRPLSLGASPTSRLSDAGGRAGCKRSPRSQVESGRWPGRGQAVRRPAQLGPQHRPWDLAPGAAQPQREAPRRTQRNRTRAAALGGASVPTHLRLGPAGLPRLLTAEVAQLPQVRLAGGEGDNGRPLGQAFHKAPGRLPPAGGRDPCNPRRAPRGGHLPREAASFSSPASETRPRHTCPPPVTAWTAGPRSPSP